MTASETIPGHVTLRCPSCGASEQAEANVLADAPIIVCRNCGDTWPATRPRVKTSRAARSPALERPPVWSEARAVDAVRRPLVSYSDNHDDIWAAKLQADMPLPAPAPRRHAGATAAAVACALFLAVFVSGREAAVAAVPDLAGLYALVGLPVNLQGLTLTGIKAERTATKGETRLVVRGYIVNVSREAKAVPPLRVSFRTITDLPGGQTTFEPPTGIVAVGEAAPFQLELQDTPENAAEVVVRFQTAPDGAGPQLASAARP